MPKSKNHKPYQNTELEFQKAFIKNSSLVLKNARFWKAEYPLFDALDLLKRETFLSGLGEQKRGIRHIGRIDLLFSYRSRFYAAEIKYHNPTDFWDATKILAYTAYYNYQNEIMEGFDLAHPAIFVPLNGVKLAHKITANKLKIVIFGIEFKNGMFAALPLNLD